MPRPVFTLKPSRSPPTKTADAVDVAARHFVYKVYKATNRRPMTWQVLREMREASATIARAVERGWVIVRPNDSGSVRAQAVA